DKPAKAYLNYTESEVKQAADAVAKINGRSKTETAIQFVLQQENVCPVVGIRNASQLHDVVSAIEASPLLPTEIQALQHGIPVNRYEQHR
ncbi:MAG TPA: aldo/keto reductase, partial [Ohtaekwangia sp.]